MMDAITHLHAKEGRDNLNRTIEFVMEALPLFGIDAVVTFTALGDGALELREKIENDSVQILAVTFPSETIATVGEERILLGIPDENVRRRLNASKIPIVQAAMPFSGFNAISTSSTANVIQQSLSMFGGGLSLCVQAILMACDAGYLKTGQRCIAFAADTAIVARAAHTQSFLSKHSGFAIEHMICKPLEYQVSRSLQPPRQPKVVKAIEKAKAGGEGAAETDAGGVSKE